MKRLLWRFCGGLAVPLVATLALGALVAWSFRYTQTVPSESSSESSVRSREKKRQRGKTDEICTDLVLSRIGSGAELATVGKVGTRRIRKGPILMPVRELVLEQLDLALPDTYFHPVPDASVPGPSVASATSVISALAEDRSHLETLLPSVAGLRVRGLRISRLADETNAVTWLQAASGHLEAADRTLALRDVTHVDGGRTNRASSAILEFKPYLRVRSVER